MQWSLPSVAAPLRSDQGLMDQIGGLSTTLSSLVVLLGVVSLSLFGVRAVRAAGRRTRIFWVICSIVILLVCSSVLLGLSAPSMLTMASIQERMRPEPPFSKPQTASSSDILANSRPLSASLPSQLGVTSESLSEQASTLLGTLMSGITSATTVPAKPGSPPPLESRTWVLYCLVTLVTMTSLLSLVSICILRLRYGSYGAVLRSVYRLLLWVFGCGMERYLSAERAQYLDGVTSLRNEWDADTRLPPAAPNELTPIVPVPIRLAGQCAIHTSLLLKSEGLGSFGLDTPDNRRIAMLRAVDLMKARGVRESHIARSAPMAVALAFVPLPEEVAAAQLGVTQANLELVEAKSRAWIDPRVDGTLQPSMAHN